MTQQLQSLAASSAWAPPIGSAPLTKSKSLLRPATLAVPFELHNGEHMLGHACKVCYTCYSRTNEVDSLHFLACLYFCIENAGSGVSLTGASEGLSQEHTNLQEYMVLLLNIDPTAYSDYSIVYIALQWLAQ